MKSESELVLQVNSFNERFSIGTNVFVQMDNGSTLTTKTTSAAWVMGGHSAMILLEGISGGYALDRVSVLQNHEATAPEVLQTGFSKLSKYDLHWAVQRLPRAVSDAMKKHGKLMIVAGGYVRASIAGEPVNDIDIFAPSKIVARTIAASLVKPERKLIETDNAYTVIGHKIPLQFIHRWTYAEPPDVVPSFDFTVARAAFWFDLDSSTWKSCCDARFYQDLAAKRLVYCSPERNEDAGGSMLRVLKFYQRGYRMPLPSLGAVIARLLNGVDEGSPLFWRGINKDGKVASETEVEAYRSKILTGLLREVDPNVDPDHIVHSSEPTEEKEAA